MLAAAPSSKVVWQWYLAGCTRHRTGARAQFWGECGLGVCTEAEPRTTGRHAEISETGSDVLFCCVLPLRTYLPAQMFGEGRHPDIDRLFETRLAPFLSHKAFSFWSTRLWYFKEGLYYQGGMVSDDRPAGCRVVWCDLTVQALHTHRNRQLPERCPDPTRPGGCCTHAAM